MGADVPHSKPVHFLLETLREHSIARSAQTIEVPPLDDPDMLVNGGQDYDAMCTGCHLKPGKLKSDFSLGLYPAPPNLSVANSDPASSPDVKMEARRQFWIIKHGIKASGMPAWGITHDDNRIWAMVAFLQKLPQLSPEQYEILTANTQGEEDHMHE